MRYEKEDPNKTKTASTKSAQKLKKELEEKQKTLEEDMMEEMKRETLMTREDVFREFGVTKQ